MHDARIIANYMLDAAARRAAPLTNLALQKLLFFAHAISLMEKKKGLVAGYFEAWKYGPVHPAVYEAFRPAGSKPIDFRAKAFNPVSRLYTPLTQLDDIDSGEICDRVILQFGRLSAGRLVDLAHAVGGPWHHVVESSIGGANVGLRIPDAVISERHRWLKVSVTPNPRVGEPDEDSPLV
jgi:uncharacterized phage-associated protein